MMNHLRDFLWNPDRCAEREVFLEEAAKTKTTFIALASFSAASAMTALIAMSTFPVLMAVFAIVLAGTAVLFRDISVICENSITIVRSWTISAAVSINAVRLADELFQKTWIIDPLLRSTAEQALLDSLEATD